MMVALLHSNRQLRTERDGDTEKGCQKPAVQQKTTDDESAFESQRHEWVTGGIRNGIWPRLLPYTGEVPVSLEGHVNGTLRCFNLACRQWKFLREKKQLATYNTLSFFLLEFYSNFVHILYEFCHFWSPTTMNNCTHLMPHHSLTTKACLCSEGGHDIWKGIV